MKRFRPRETHWRIIDGRYSPVVVLESWSPVGCLEKGLQGASQVDESVAHQEEHGEERSDLVNVAWEQKCKMVSSLATGSLGYHQQLLVRFSC